MVSLEAKRFVDKVSYILSPGYLDGGTARQVLGFIGNGPSAIITTLGVSWPHPQTRQFQLDAYFSLSSVEEILA